MKTDTLNRRRGIHRHSTGKGVVTTPALVDLALSIRRKGPLPTPLLFLDWEGKRYAHFQNRMTDFSTETKGGGPFFYLPPQLNPEFGPNYEPYWYDLTPAGRALAEGAHDFIFPPKKDPWHHRAMGASIATSFEHLASEQGLTYVDKEEILADDRTPTVSCFAENPLTIPVGSGFLEPDDLFGLKNADGNVRFFIREDDRAHESFYRADSGQTSVQRKLERYFEIFRQDLFRKRWGFAKPRILFTTTKPGRVDKMMRFLEGKPYATQFYFKVLPTFGTGTWRAPRKPIAELYGPWQTVAGPKHLFEP